MGSAFKGQLGAEAQIEEATKQGQGSMATERQEPHMVVKDRVLIYMEEQGHRCLKRKLDFDSPRTLEAAGKLGITFEDCLKRCVLSSTLSSPRSEFFTPGADSRVAQLGYDRHCLKIHDTILSVYKLRKKTSSCCRTWL